MSNARLRLLVVEDFGDGTDFLLRDNRGPLRMRLSRQVGYKGVKFITQLTVADSVKGFGKG